MPALGHPLRASSGHTPDKEGLKRSATFVDGKPSMPGDAPGSREADPGLSPFRRTLVRISLALLLVAWLAVLLWTWTATSSGSRARAVQVTVSLLGVALAGLAARDGWQGRWGTWGGSLVGLQAVIGLVWTVTMGAAWGWWVMLFSLTTGLSLGFEGEPLPEDSGRRIAILGLALVALAPVVDATLLGPAAEPEPRLQPGSSYEAQANERWSADAGSIRVAQTPLNSTELPDVDLVTIAVPADRDRLSAFEVAFREQHRASYAIPVPFPPFVIVEQSEVSRHATLDEGWEAAAIGYEKSDRLLGLLGTVEGERQNVLVRPTDEVDHVRLMPPSLQSWEILSGYRFHEEGNTSRALDVLANHTTLQGQPLVPPPEAEEHVRLSGEYAHGVPGPGVAALLAAVAGSLTLNGSRRRNR